jgi:hypothetical protein
MPSRRAMSPSPASTPTTGGKCLASSETASPGSNSSVSAPEPPFRTDNLPSTSGPCRLRSSDG